MLFDFGAPTVPQDNTNVGAAFVARTVGLYTLTAYGFDSPSNTAHNLFYKNDGADEHGLGLVGTLDNELTLTSGPVRPPFTPANYMEIDVSSVYLLPGTSGAIRIQSVTDGESYNVWGSNTLGQMGVPQLITASTVNNDFVNLPSWGTYQFYSVAVNGVVVGSTIPAAPDNVLFDAVQVQGGTPELPPIALLGTVPFGLALLRRRRR
jgi:hypothetical protein